MGSDLVCDIINVGAALGGADTVYKTDLLKCSIAHAHSHLPAFVDTQVFEFPVFAVSVLIEALEQACLVKLDVFLEAASRNSGTVEVGLCKPKSYALILCTGGVGM